ncbi:MAG: hypothetical protein ABIJ12_08360, partial [bacterium]
MCKSIVSIFIILLFTTPVFSQLSRNITDDDDIFAKEILTSSASVRSNGMGMIGVILTDGQSFINNPATLGFMDNEYFSSSIYLKKSKANEYVPMRAYPNGATVTGSDINSSTTIPYYNDISISVNLNSFSRVKKSLFNFGVGYSRHSLSYGDVVWLDGSNDTQQNESEVLTAPGNFDDHINIYSIGMSYNTFVGIGLGINYKNTNFKLNNTKYSSDLFDLGLLLQIPLEKLTSAINKNANNRFESKLVLGMSVVNLGNDLKFDTLMLSPPKYSRFGAGLDLAFIKNNIKLASIYPALQYDYLFYADNSHITRLGFEAGILDILYMRTGRMSSSNQEV